MPIAEDNLIFDLDGTLFDSAPEILVCLKKALQLNNIDINDNLNKSIIGPPLKETLKNLVQKEDTVKIDKIIENFIELYDSDYCYKTKLYKGVQETLKILEKKKNLILITNKRIVPTEKMLKNSKIIELFDNYFSVDPNDQSKKDKSTLISKTIKDYKIDPQNTAYIGDTMGDFIASKKNNIKFIFAGWGYGKYVEDADLHLTDIREML
tara:strand:+ start:6013 stop:6639 length:627 start_codon:yes stop_codon:yes gene_type:complete